MQKAIDWQQIKSEFQAGATLNSLAGKYQISLETIKTRHRTDHWAQARKEYKRTLNEMTTKKLAEEQLPKTLSAVQVIDLVVEDLLQGLPQAISGSKEGTAKAIGDLLKIRGTYTGETSEKNKGEQTISADLVYKIIVGGYKPPGFQDTKVSLPPESN